MAVMWGRGIAFCKVNFSKCTVYMDRELPHPDYELLFQVGDSVEKNGPNFLAKTILRRGVKMIATPPNSMSMIMSTSTPCGSLPTASVTIKDLAIEDLPCQSKSLISCLPQSYSFCQFMAIRFGQDTDGANHILRAIVDGSNVL